MSFRVPLRAPTRLLKHGLAGQSVVGIYRIAVLGQNTTLLEPATPGPQNSGLSKAGFYVFHAAPEFLAAAILMALNVRRVFATGMWGDTRRRDPEPEPQPAQAPIAKKSELQAARPSAAQLPSREHQGPGTISVSARVVPMLPTAPLVV